ncbi:MAG: hypothetical protein GF409_01880 [Candidatus Omnitrophica bacterium]|nr:hypothetical protein [Candidatus Omnitrophota bacterium]
MTEKDFQKDFFEGQVYEEKGRKPLFPRRHPDRIFLPHLKIPVEYAVIISISVLVLIIIAYAAGVERGKRLIGIAGDVPESKDYAMSSVAAQEAGDKPIAEEQTVTVVETQTEEEVEELKEKELPEEEPVPTEQDEKYDTKKYVIQLASFKNRENAETEAERLRRNDIQAGINKKGSWYQVYASGYATIEDAREAKRLLSADYKDCYIRRLK